MRREGAKAQVGGSCAATAGGPPEGAGYHPASCAVFSPLLLHAHLTGRWRTGLGIPSCRSRMSAISAVSENGTPRGLLEIPC